MIGWRSWYIGARSEVDVFVSSRGMAEVVGSIERRCVGFVVSAKRVL